MASADLLWAGWRGCQGLAIDSCQAALAAHFLHTSPAPRQWVMFVACSRMLPNEVTTPESVRCAHGLRNTLIFSCFLYSVSGPSTRRRTWPGRGHPPCPGWTGSCGVPVSPAKCPESPGVRLQDRPAKCEGTTAAQAAVVISHDGTAHPRTCGVSRRHLTLYLVGAPAHLQPAPMHLQL